MQDFEVNVIRGDKEGTSFFGMFVSKVYAIDGNKFLVYDYGDGDLITPHFEWVDFTQSVPDRLNIKYKYEEQLLYYVTLYEPKENL